MMSGFLRLSAHEAIALMRRGELKAEEYATALLARAGALAHLNAFISLFPEQVMEAAQAADRHRAAGGRLGPLHGLPIPIKDSVNTADHPTTSGTAALRDFRPKDDAPVVRSLRDAGAIVLGKTNLAELSLGWTSTNVTFGAVRNPYDPNRIPGGSTGGTAVAVATGMAPLGVAEDTCGSIRVPAALCGIAGLRPSTGRYSSRGVMPLAPLFDTVGSHARTVADLLLFDSVLTGDFRPPEPVHPTGARLGLSRAHYFADLDPEVELVTNEALKKLADAGVTLEQLLALASESVRENLEARAIPGGRLWVSDEDYAAARDLHRPALQEAFRAHFRQTAVAAIAYPTTLVPATPIGQEREVGIELDGPAGSDRELLALGLALEPVISCAAMPVA